MIINNIIIIINNMPGCWFSLMKTSKNEIYGWGSNNDKQLTGDDKKSIDSPILIFNSKDNIKSIGTGCYHFWYS